MLSATRMSQGQFSEHWLARVVLAACLAILLTIPAQTLRRLANGLETGCVYQNNGRIASFWDFHGDSAGHEATNGGISTQYYGYAPDGRVSWTYRAAGGDQTGHNSPVENNLGDAYYYNPDGTFNTVYRNINVPSGWPQAQSPGYDSRVGTSSYIYPGGSTPGAFDGCVYDAAGNRTEVVRSFQLSYYPAADGENRYAGWTYDANGNVTNANLGWTYQYDAENKLTQANGPGGVVLQYAYDAAGRLVERVANGVPTFFYYAGSQRIEERNGSLSLVYSYYYEAPGSDRLLCRQDATWGLLWYLYDGQGNVTHLCDNAGNVLERYLYDAFGTPTVYDPSGNQRPAGSAYDNRYLFKSAGGYEWQPQAHLYYCRERFYLPYHGRWLQPDPIGQAGVAGVFVPPLELESAALIIAAGAEALAADDQPVVAELENAGNVQTTLDALSSAATRAADSVGSGVGRVYGTLVHTAFRKTVETLNNPTLFTEQSYLKGIPVDYGTSGSVRVDVAEGTVLNPTAIFDLKTGAAVLTPARILQIQSHLPEGARVPVYEVRP